MLKAIAKRVLLFLVISSSLILTGCWDYNDFNDLALVSAFGFDFDEKTQDITMTVQYYIPGGTGGEGAGGGGSHDKGGTTKNLPSTGVVIAKGKTISDALGKVQQTRRKELFYAYMDIFIIGQTAAKNIMKQIVDFSDRTPNVRSTLYIAIAKGTAEEVLTTLDPNISITTGRNIHDMIDQSSHAGSAFPVSLEDFSENLVIGGIEPTAPVVTVVIDKSEGTSDGGKSAGGSSGSSQSGSTSGVSGPQGSGSGSGASGVTSSSAGSEGSEDEGAKKISKLKDGFQKITGLAVFKKDKLVGWLNTTECTGLGWITNKNMSPYENVPNGSSKDIKNTLVFNVISCKSKIKAEVKNGKPEITVKTDMQAALIKYAENINAEELTPDIIKYMEKKLAENVMSEINAALNKCQKELKTDVFGFGFQFYRQNTKLWHKEYEKKWDDIYPDVKINVMVKAKIQNTGTNVRKFNTK